MNKSLAWAAVVLAAALPIGSAQAHGNVAIRIDTPEFGIRIGTPFPIDPPPVIVTPAPVYLPPPVIYVPPPRVIVPAPVYYYYGPPAFRPPHHYRTHHKVKHYKVKYDKGRDWYDD